MRGLALAGQPRPHEALLPRGEAAGSGLSDDDRAARRKRWRERDARRGADRVALLSGDAEPGQVPEAVVEEELDRAELGGYLALRVAGAAADYASLADADGQVGGNDVEVAREKDAGLAPGGEDVGAAFAQREDDELRAEAPQRGLEKGEGGRLAAGRRICGAELRQ